VANTDRGVLGILGGMGPLASAEFVRNLYELNVTSKEQLMPRIILDSDPSFPDRTEAITTGRHREMADFLQNRLGGLAAGGAHRIVIACVTAHHFLDLVDPPIRSRVVSLVTTTVRELSARQGRFLLLATEGTRRSCVFERAPAWPSVASRVAWPTPSDQDTVHKLIYGIKSRTGDNDIVPVVDKLRTQYGCTGLILGCTEFHLYARPLMARFGAGNIVDALWAIADSHPSAADAT
jgi:aspartate racemase